MKHQISGLCDDGLYPSASQVWGSLTQQTDSKDSFVKNIRTFLPILTFLLLLGCASTGDNLARETARTIGGLRPEQVTVSDVKRGVTSVSWTATTPNGIYDCSADDMVRRVNAVKREGK